MHNLVSRYNDVDPEEHKQLLSKHEAAVVLSLAQTDEIAAIKAEISILQSKVNFSQVLQFSFVS